MFNELISNKKKTIVIAIVSVATLIVAVLLVIIFISMNNASRSINLDVTDIPTKIGPSMARADDLKLQAAAALNNNETGEAIRLYKLAYEQFMKVNTDEADNIKVKLCQLGEQEYCGTESQ